MPVKNVEVSAEMKEGTLIECRAGAHTFLIDQNKAGGGNDQGPSPLEYYLASLAGCVASIGRIVARQKNMTLRGMSIKTVGEINTDVLLGRSTSERAGFKVFNLTVAIDADLTHEQKREFLEEVERRCPVSENTTNPSLVKLTLV
ncbi:MAG: OsmC family protein [Oligoflexia bacterium]|nr:OsmC family protein [Oligoflexia bacterium]